MAVEVNFIDEVRSRIAAAMVSPGVLSSVKSLRVGFIPQAKTPTDHPSLALNLSAGTLDQVASNSIRREEVSIDVTLIANKLPGALNCLYKTSDSTGPMYLFSNLKNVIEKNTSGAIDPGFAGTCESLLESSYTVAQDENIVVYTLTLRAKTKSFRSGGR